MLNSDLDFKEEMSKCLNIFPFVYTEIKYIKRQDLWIL